MREGVKADTLTPAALPWTSRDRGEESTLCTDAVIISNQGIWAGKEVLEVGMVEARIGSGASPPPSTPAWTAALELIPSVEILTSC